MAAQGGIGMTRQPLIAVAWLGACALAAGPALLAQTPPINPTVTTCNITPPNTPITPALLTSGLPCAATLIPPFTLDGLQQGFDYYSWLTFLALNAPASGGKPIGQGPLPGGDAPTIWEGWKEISDVMLPGGATPQPWGSPGVIPLACQGLAPAGTPLLKMVGKTPNVLSAFDQPFKTGPIIDQNGFYARFAINMNQPMFEYIVTNTLYSKQGQGQFNGAVAFPPGQVTSGTTGTIGAIMVKSSWRVLGAGDNRSTFHAMDALVYTAPLVNPKIDASCSKQTLGMVGLHIGHKTTDEPQWLWSTFEHVRNVPTVADISSGKASGTYNFYNAACSAQQCPVNEPPPKPWNPNVQPFPNGFKSQIARVIPVTTEVANLNTGFQAILSGTVWANYMLVSTQWPTNAASKVDPTGAPAPTYLANSTLESYIQGTVPGSSSNCIACHNNATTLHVPATPSDFTYILQSAQ
jgi:hypothetical protein